MNPHVELWNVDTTFGRAGNFMSSSKSPAPIPLNAD